MFVYPSLSVVFFLSVSQSVGQSVGQSVSQPASQSVRPSVCLPACLPARLSVCLSVCLSTYLVCLSLWLLFSLSSFVTKYSLFSYPQRRVHCVRLKINWQAVVLGRGFSCSVELYRQSPVTNLWSNQSAKWRPSGYTYHHSSLFQHLFVRFQPQFPACVLYKNVLHWIQARLATTEYLFTDRLSSAPSHTRCPDCSVKCLLQSVLRERRKFPETRRCSYRLCSKQRTDRLHFNLLSMAHTRCMSCWMGLCRCLWIHTGQTIVQTLGWRVPDRTMSAPTLKEQNLMYNRGELLFLITLLL